MHRLSAAISVAISIFVIVAVHGSWLYYSELGESYSRRISIKVAPGATFKEVQAELVDKGIVRRPNVFRWAAWLTRRETKIKTGKYIFRQGESVASVLDKLVSGDVDYARVVIPEGLMMSEIASIVQKEAEIDSAEFMMAAADSFLIVSLGIEAKSLEGYLFPDTYLFDWPLTEKDVISRMVHRFMRVYGQSVADAADSSGLSLNEIVTLASIIQAEAVFRSEMPRISAVYHNRLEAGWRLEADPTVAYALGGVRRRLWYKDLRIDSPYNTYRIRGLPPGPICSPGRSALMAAVSPLEGSSDFYFVADGTGRHRFSETYHEHLKAKHFIKYGPMPTEIQKKPFLEAIGEDGAATEASGQGDTDIPEVPSDKSAGDGSSEKEADPHR